MTPPDERARKAEPFKPPFRIVDATPVPAVFIWDANGKYAAGLTEEDAQRVKVWRAMLTGPHLANMSNSAIKDGFTELLAIIDRLTRSPS